MKESLRRQTTVLIAVNMQAHFREMFRLAKLLQESAEYKPVILMDHPVYNYDQEIRFCQQEKVHYLHTRQRVGDGPAVRTIQRNTRSAAAGFLRRLLKRMRYSLLGIPVDMLMLMGALRHNLRILKEVKPGLLVLPFGDRGHLAMWVKAGQLMKIPSLVLPYAIMDPRQHLRQAVQMPERDYRRWSNFLAVWFYPSWFGKFENKKAVAAPASLIFSLQWMNAAPACPWEDTLGNADILAVEGKRLAEVYKNNGLPEDKFRFTGTLSDDVLYQEIQQAKEKRQALYRRYGWSTDKKLIVASLTPNQGVEAHRGVEFESYEEMVRFWTASLGNLQNYCVIISPHPRADRQLLNNFITSQVQVSSEQITQLVPLADIFVSEPSAVIRPAAACGKPVVCYDLWGYGFSAYKPDEGVLMVNTKTAFVSILSRLTQEEEYYLQMCRRQEACAAQWGQLDGQAGKRVLSLLDEMVRKG